MKNLRLVLWAVTALVIVVFILVTLPRKGPSPAPDNFAPIAGFNKAPHFTLTSHNNEVFGSDKRLKQGDYALVFFGFTNCPAICPTELQKFATVMDRLPASDAARLTPLFITIDPDRDTVDALAAYVPQFHEKIIGLTGDSKTIKSVLNGWKVYAAKVNDPQFSEYTMDHSTYSYLVDADMNILALFRLQDRADAISEKIEAIIP